MSARPRTGLGIEEIIGDKRDEILRLAEQYGASNVRVFGSVARGEAGPDSDLDLLVDFRPDYTLLDQAGLVMALQQLLGCRVEIANAAHLREEMRSPIMRDARSL